MLFNFTGLIFSLSLLILNTHAAVKEISIHEVKELFLKNNSKIQLALIDYEIANQELEAAYFPFDPELTLNYSTDKTKKLPNSTLDRTVVTELKKGPSLGMMRKFGFGHELALTVQNLYIKTDSLVSRLPTRYQSSGQLKLTLPLLKNSTSVVNEELIDVSKLKINEKRTELLKIINVEFAQAYKDYLAWLLATDNYHNHVNLEKSSYEYFLLTQKKFDLGKKSIIERDEGEAVWLKKKAQLYGAEKEMESAKMSFLRNISTGQNFNEWMDSIPTGHLTTLDLTSFQSNAPQLKLEDIKFWEWEQDKRKIQTAEKNLNPELNVTVNAISSGLHETSGEAFQQIFKYTYPTWEFKLELKIPWDNSLARGQFQAASARGNASYYGYLEEKRRVLLSANQLKRDHEKVKQKVQESEKYLKLAEHKWQKGNLLHQQGRISDLEWLTLEQDYQDALLENHRELIKQHEIQLDLLASSGQLLSENELKENLK